MSLCLLWSLSTRTSNMASMSWALLLFLAHLHTLLSNSSAHRGDGGNITHLPVPFLCHLDQAKALLQLKKSFFFGRSTTKRPSWQHGTDCCLWEGVGCDAASGNLTVLDLNNYGLSSYGLDPSIFSLTSLRRLDLSMNDFSAGRFASRRIPVWSDNIPATGFERFTLLTHLNLSESALYGRIPLGISKLMNLISLDLSNSFYYDCDRPDLNPLATCNGMWEPSFDTLVANLTNLRELYLDDVYLPLSVQELCTSLATSVPRLQVLSSSNCDLSGPIHVSLSKLQSLTVINLGGNNDIPALWTYTRV